MLHSTKKSTNSKKSTRFEFIDRKLKAEKIETECNVTMTTIICLISSLSSTMLLSLICKKRWNSKTVAITIIEKLLKVNLLIKKLLKKVFESTTKDFYKRYNAFKKIKKKSFYNCQKIKKNDKWRFITTETKAKDDTKMKVKKWKKKSKKKEESTFVIFQSKNEKTRRRRFINRVKTRFIQTNALLMT